MRDAPTGAAAELYRQAAQLRQAANYAEAEQHLLQALELEHDCAPAHLELGLTYRDQARMEDAVDYFQLAVHFAPALVAGWLELGAGLQSRNSRGTCGCAQGDRALEPRNSPRGCRWGTDQGRRRLERRSLAAIARMRRARAIGGTIAASAMRCIWWAVMRQRARRSTFRSR